MVTTLFPSLLPCTGLPSNSILGARVQDLRGHPFRLGKKQQVQAEQVWKRRVVGLWTGKKNYIEKTG